MGHREHGAMTQSSQRKALFIFRISVLSVSSVAKIDGLCISGLGIGHREHGAQTQSFTEDGIRSFSQKRTKVTKRGLAVLTV
jgi:hypothetical protein